MLRDAKGRFCKAPVPDAVQQEESKLLNAFRKRIEEHKLDIWKDGIPAHSNYAVNAVDGPFKIQVDQPCYAALAYMRAREFFIWVPFYELDGVNEKDLYIKYLTYLTQESTLAYVFKKVYLEEGILELDTSLTASECVTAALAARLITEINHKGMKGYIKLVPDASPKELFFVHNLFRQWAPGSWGSNLGGGHSLWPVWSFDNFQEIWDGDRKPNPQHLEENYRHPMNKGGGYRIFALWGFEQRYNHKDPLEEFYEMVDGGWDRKIPRLTDKSVVDFMNALKGKE